MKQMSYTAFLENVVSKYFPLKNYNNLPTNVLKFFEGRSENYVDKKYYVPEAVSNIVELNIKHYLKKDKTKFLFNFESLKVYLFEYTKTYYRSNQENTVKYVVSELITDIYIYDTLQNKVVAYLEGRIDVSDFTTLTRHCFIGFIHVDESMRRQKVATFMLRVMSLYSNLRRRVPLTSDTCMTPEMQKTCQYLSFHTKWTIRNDYHNNESKKIQERYIFNPIKLNVSVLTGGEEYIF